jgi:hypothetical protein
VDKLEYELVAGTQVPYGRSKASKVDGVKCGLILPLMYRAALLEEVRLGSGLADVMFVMSGDCGRANAELDFGGWIEGYFFLGGWGVAELEGTSGFVGVNVELGCE